MNVAEPGYTTTEFWVAMVTSLIGLLVMFRVVKITNEQTQAIIGLVALIAPQVIYIISRGIRKQGTTTTVAKSTQQQLPPVLGVG